MGRKPTYEELEQKVRKLEKEAGKRKQAESALSKSEKKYKALFNNAQVALFRTGAYNGEILEINERYANLAGYGNIEDCMAEFNAADAWVDPNARDALVEILKENGFVNDYDTEIICRDGSHAWISFSATIFPEEGFLEGSIVDINDRKKAEQALQAKGEFLDRVIDQSPFAVWISDAKGTLQRPNPALKKFLNLTDEQLVGKYNVLEDPLIERQGLMPLIRSVFEEGKSINFTADWNGEDIPTMDLKGSNSVSIEANMFPIHNPEGELTNVVLNWVDITDRIESEKDLKKYREHLEELVDERTAALEGKNKDLETFTYSVSHDLKAPLRGIDGYSRLLLEEYGEKLDEEGQQFLQNVRHSAEQMNQLIEDLLAYSRMERRDIQFVSIDLPSMLDALIQEREQDLTHRNIELKSNIPFQEILCDRESIRQILGNLLDNAIKFTRDKSAARIVVNGSETPEHWTLWVKDNGLGFDPKYQELIFGIFQRLHRSEEYPGTGVGLAIAQKAINRMGGRIWAEGELGKGAVFYVQVPKPKASSPTKG